LSEPTPPKPKPPKREELVADTSPIVLESTPPKIKPPKPQKKTAPPPKPKKEEPIIDTSPVNPFTKPSTPPYPGPQKSFWEDIQRVPPPPWEEEKTTPVIDWETAKPDVSPREEQRDQQKSGQKGGQKGGSQQKGKQKQRLKNGQREKNIFRDMVITPAISGQTDFLGGEQKGRQKGRQEGGQKTKQQTKTWEEQEQKQRFRQDLFQPVVPEIPQIPEPIEPKIFMSEPVLPPPKPRQRKPVFPPFKIDFQPPKTPRRRMWEIERRRSRKRRVKPLKGKRWIVYNPIPTPEELTKRILGVPKTRKKILCHMTSLHLFTNFFSRFQGLSTKRTFKIIAFSLQNMQTSLRQNILNLIFTQKFTSTFQIEK